MSFLPLTLLRDRDVFWTALRERTLRPRDLAVLALFVVLGCAVYGAVLAGWRSPVLSLYVAVKLPVLFLGSMAVVAVANWMVAALMGSGLAFRDTLFIVFGAMTVAAWMLLALAPVALFLQLSGVPSEGAEEVLRYSHAVMLGSHIGVLAMVGVAGNAALVDGLQRSVRPQCRVRSLFFAWIACFAFVGCQLAWILRPFVGNPFRPVAFLRTDALAGNFYEFVLGNLLPYLLGIRP